MGKLDDIASTLRSKKKLPFDGKQWTPGDLLIYLAQEVRRLRKQQCVPGMHCIFKYDDYIEEVYGSDSGDQSIIKSTPKRRTD